MVLAGHSDDGYLNETHDRSRTGAHIFLSEDEPTPRQNFLILTIAKIIKFVMSSATKSELAAVFITVNKMVPLLQTLIEMRWPQPPSPLQTDNSAAAGVTNNTNVPRQTKSTDMRFTGCIAVPPNISSVFIGPPGVSTGATKLPRITHHCTTKSTAIPILANTYLHRKFVGN